MHYDVAVIGGGAAGLAAAVLLCQLAEQQGRPIPRIAVLERQPRVGKKLLATGNGTCNITNLAAGEPLAHERYYHSNGGDTGFPAAALSAFPPSETIRFFHSIGVYVTSRPDGRCYPLCQQAGAVLDNLRLALSHYGVAELANTEVTEILPQSREFTLKTGVEPLLAGQVIVAAGGAAAPALGGGTSGYQLLTRLGHTRTPLYPSIVQVKADTTYLSAMQGVRVEGLVSFWEDGRLLAQQQGEILFTEYGLSGPAVMQISRHAARWEHTDPKRRGTLIAKLHFLPDLSKEELLRELRHRRGLHRTAADYLNGLVHKRVGQTVVKAAGIPLSQPAGQLTEQQVQDVCRLLTDFPVQVRGTRGFGGAQVTAGGIATAEFHPETMESRLIPGLYGVGELLDVDGDCGGFNLQWAWSSAFLAARAIGKKIFG